MHSASIRLFSPGPSTAAKAIASNMPGKAKNTSVICINSLSTQPPKYPAINPMATPKVKVMLVTIKATVMETCAPARMRLRISRPRSSLPSHATVLGDCSITSRLMASGDRLTMAATMTTSSQKISTYAGHVLIAKDLIACLMMNSAPLGPASNKSGPSQDSPAHRSALSAARKPASRDNPASRWIPPINARHHPNQIPFR